MQPSEPYDLELQLMQKQRNIADLEAKIKKNQFKQNRTMQEHKIMHERLQQLVKEEKQKCDKLSKSSRGKEEQNQLLLAKVAQLRQEKEREVAELRGLYNGLKEEVRTYQRVLPTLTFLNEYCLRIQDIPTYEHIFLQLKNKIVQLQQTQQKYKHFQTKSIQNQNSLRQNEQTSNQKRQQAQRRLKQLLSKLADSQHQLAEQRSITLEQEQTLQALRYELELKTQKQQSLESTIRESELKLEQLDRAYSYQLLTKEEQIRALTQEQFDRYEDEMRSLEHRLEIKDKMYVQQVQILEEEVYFLKNVIAEEKEHFQENYLVIKGEIQRMQAEVDQERTSHDELKKKYGQLDSHLLSSNKEKDILKAQKITLQKNIASLKEQEKVTPVMSDIHVSQMQNLQQSYSQLLNKFEHVTDRIGRYQEENRNLEDEVAHLRNQLITKNIPQPHHLLELPTHYFQPEETVKRKSTESQIEIEEDLIHIQQIKKSQSPTPTQPQNLKENNNNNIEQLTTLKKQKDIIKSQLLKTKQKTNQLSSSLSQKQQQLLTLNKNHILLKTKTNSLQQQLSFITQEQKRQKDILKILREQLKSLKEITNQQTSKYLKEKKEINAQFQIYKNDRDKIKLQYAFREKNLMIEISQLRKTLQGQEYNKRQILLLRKQVLEHQGSKKMMGQEIIEKKKEVERLSFLIENLSDDCKHQERQSVNLEEMLSRERKERGLLAVPSLQEFGNSKNHEETAFNDIYANVTRKQSEINFLERQMSDLKEELESLKISHMGRIEAMEQQQNDYVQTIIEMKMRCAQSEMKASQSTFQYSQLKKRMSSKLSL